MGLTLFVPLIELMGDATGQQSRLFAVFRDVFAVIGVSFTLLPTLGGIVVLVIGGFSLAYLQRRLLVDARQRCGRNLRAEIIGRLMHSSWPHLSMQGKGEVINQMLVEVGRASAALQAQVMLVAALIQVVILALICAALSWQMALVALVFAGGIVLVTRPLLRRAAALGEETNTANRNFSFHTVDYLSGARLIKVTASEDSILSRIGSLNERLYAVLRDLDYNSVLLHFLLQAAPVVIVAVVIAGAHEIIGIATSYILVFLLILARIAPRVAELQLKYENYAGFVPGLHVIDEAIDAATANEERTRRGGKVFKGLQDGIRIDAVSFDYADSNEPVIDNVSLRIPRNQMIALVGPSGVGKSTLIDLIVGLREPAAGRIWIDDTDLADMDLLSWRRRIGYVTQDIIIFNDTLRSNLVFARPEASTAEIEECLRIAHLDEVVAAMPQGVDTVLGEGGMRLSGGQRQRLALARALVGKPELLLLDEATSALDTESERLVQKAIEAIAHMFTVVIIAHRLSTVRRADLIYVMENGRIVESGTYETLLARNGRLAKLHNAQHG